MAKNKKTAKKTPKITSKMRISEAISEYPETMEVFLKHGFHCFGCMAADFENLKRAAKVHGIKLADLLKDLNRAIEKPAKKKKVKKQK